MDTREKPTVYTDKQLARRMDNGDLAASLKTLRAAAVQPAVMALSEDANEVTPTTVTLTSAQMAYVDEAAERLNMLNIMGLMTDGQNLQYTDAKIKELPDEQLASLVKAQRMDVLMDTGDPENPLNLSPQGEACLERRLARECAERLERHAARAHGHGALKEYIEEHNCKIKPYRPGE